MWCHLLPTALLVTFMMCLSPSTYLPSLDTAGIIFSLGQSFSKPILSTTFSLLSAHNGPRVILIGLLRIQISTLMPHSCYDPRHPCQAQAGSSSVRFTQLLYNDPASQLPYPGYPAQNSTAKLEQAEQQMFLVFCLAI